MNQTPKLQTEISPCSLKGRIAPINMEKKIDIIKNLPPIPEKKSKNKKKTYRCCFEGCRRKLNLVQQNKKCKCEFIFCSKHFRFEDHDCKFDYKAFSKKKYEATVNLGGGAFAKVNII